MAKLKTKDVRQMSKAEKKAKLAELNGELMHERGLSAMGGAPKSPGKIRSLRSSIARIKTIMNQEGEK